MQRILKLIETMGTEKLNDDLGMLYYDIKIDGEGVRTYCNEKILEEQPIIIFAPNEKNEINSFILKSS